MANSSSSTFLIAQAEHGEETNGEHDTVDHAVTTEGGADGPAEQAHEELHAGTEAHGDGHSDLFPPFDPASFTSQLLWLAITFAVLYLVVSRVALPRIGGILEDRQSRIDADLAAADASRQRTDAAIADYEAALSAARSRSNALAEQTRNSIQADIAGKRRAVEADLASRLAEAEASIRASRTEAMSHVDEIATDTAEALVSQLTGSVSRDDARAAVASVLKS
jgi:F-type H+-transporting ATPase subunit b